MRSHTFHKVIRATGALSSLALAAALSSVALPARAAAGHPPCAQDPPARALDFWLGHWTVTDGEIPSRATSIVSLRLGECLIVEHWSDSAGHRGENLFGYNPDSKTWNGMFADNRGRMHLFDRGTVTAGRAELYGRSAGPRGERILNRISIVRMTPDVIDQIWQQSADDGASWTIVFEGKYSRSRP